MKRTTAPTAPPCALAAPPRLRRGPRMLRIRHDKPLHEADSLPTLQALVDGA